MLARAGRRVALVLVLIRAPAALVLAVEGGSLRLPPDALERYLAAELARDPDVVASRAAFALHDGRLTARLGSRCGRWRRPPRCAIDSRAVAVVALRDRLGLAADVREPARQGAARARAAETPAMRRADDARSVALAGLAGLRGAARARGGARRRPDRHLGGAALVARPAPARPGPVALAGGAALLPASSVSGWPCACSAAASRKGAGVELGDLGDERGGQGGRPRAPAGPPPGRRDRRGP